MPLKVISPPEAAVKTNELMAPLMVPTAIVLVDTGQLLRPNIGEQIERKVLQTAYGHWGCACDCYVARLDP